MNNQVALLDLWRTIWKLDYVPKKNELEDLDETELAELYNKADQDILVKHRAQQKEAIRVKGEALRLTIQEFLKENAATLLTEGFDAAFGDGSEVLTNYERNLEELDR